MSLEIDVLSVGYHCPRYWTLWVGRVCTDLDTPGGGACLLKIGTRGDAAIRYKWRPQMFGVRLVFDALWLSWPIKHLRSWAYRRRFKLDLERATQYDPYCACGHTIHSHMEVGCYFMVPCKMCECDGYRPQDAPVCACGHHADEHRVVGHNLFSGCMADDCKCVKYDPLDTIEDIGRMVHGVLNELDQQ